jgi:Secretion system C-terminal sorting domain
LVTLWTTTGVNMFHQSCTGQSFGESVKTIMNHNSTNQYLLKAPQDYDTESWWNRTHFAFYGDPSINLYQIIPPSNVSINVVANDAVLQWSNSTDPQLVGYHIFESDSALGKFKRISTNIITGNAFTIPNYQFGKWYMVKAVASVTTGCGKFLQSSLGKEIQGNITLGTDENSLRENVLQVYPNPATKSIYIYNLNFSDKSIAIITSTDGKVIASKILSNNSIDIADLQSGIYFIQITQDNKSYTLKFAKE